MIADTDLDRNERNAAVRERERNVVIDAGAGTGKTTILVDRLVGMVAPEDAVRAVPIERIAAVTFTRRAAGELRLRIRERLLAELARSSRSPETANHLRDALAGLDTAYIGTIHSFADRLLRQRPAEARLSPDYEVHEDDGWLVHETADILFRAAQARTLATELSGSAAEGLAREAEETIADALRCELHRDSVELEWIVLYGLEGLVQGFIRERDVAPALPEPEPLDVAAFHRAADELAGWIDPLGGDSVGLRWLRGTASLVRELRDEADPVRIFQRGVSRLIDKPKDANKGSGFASDEPAYKAWKAFNGDTAKKPVRSPPLRDDLLAPLRRWLAVRLVRLFPVVIALYERVKQRHRAVDQIDLLLQLRDLLRDDAESRQHYQSLFDHVLVDEFQDTDPLQAEIILYLCEDGPRTGSWRDVALTSGKLTIVGDAKQSIYRFRRADVAMYDDVRAKLASGALLTATLATNFRSTPALITWLNDRFDEVLGKPENPSLLLDRETGRVFHRALDPGRSAGGDGETRAAVHVIPLEPAPDAPRDAAALRDLEGVALARYLRWLCGNEDVLVENPLTRERRPACWGDVAVLALATYELQRLFVQLDREGIPHATRGGTLFLEDPLHRRFLLALRAVADRDDGVARAALLRPPFFAIDPSDLLAERVANEAEPTGPGARRARDAIDWLRDLRRRRFERPPGDTARDLIEKTALGAYVARRPNGAQRLRLLRELCALLEQRAAAEGLDYDAATARLREWVDRPAQLDPPLQVGADAVRVLTVHQAKGLEFPVVILWDSRAQWASPEGRPAWRVERDGSSWAMALQGLAWEHPAEPGLKDREKRYRDHERRRLVYVAATRARDLLVLPRSPGLDARNIHQSFLHAPPGTVEVLPPYRSDAEPDWALARGRPDTTLAGRVDPNVRIRWDRAIERAATPRFRPEAVTHASRRDDPSVAGNENAVTSPLQILRRATAEEDGIDPALAEPVSSVSEMSRHGPLFGTTVHRAIALAARSHGEPLPDVVARVAARTGLDEHLGEAQRDIERALEALAHLGLFEARVTLRFEYPVAGPGADGVLLAGAVDLVAATPEWLFVIDFKTDAPPDAGAPHGHYFRQLRLYAGLLEPMARAGERRLRAVLLYTADGSIHAL